MHDAWRIGRLFGIVLVPQARGVPGAAVRPHHAPGSTFCFFTGEHVGRAAEGADDGCPADEEAAALATFDARR